jgi:hypothetical protein
VKLKFYSTSDQSCRPYAAQASTLNTTTTTTTTTTTRV